MSYVRDVLTGLTPIDLDRNHRHALDPLLQQWNDESRRKELNAGFRELLQDPDPKLRAAAVQFFVTTDADDTGLLFDAYQNNLQDFEGVSRHWYPGEGTLDALLVLAISKRMPPGSDELVCVKEEALHSGRGAYTVAGLMAVDADWLLENVVPVVKNSPDALPAILYNAMLQGKSRIDILMTLKAHFPVEELIEALRSVLPKEVWRMELLLTDDRVDPHLEQQVFEGFKAPSAADRLEAIRQAAAHPDFVGPLSRLHDDPLEGCEEWVSILPEDRIGEKDEFWARFTLRRTIVQSLTEIGATGRGLIALLKTSGEPGGHRRAATLALGEVDQQQAIEVLDRLMASTVEDFELAVNGISGVALEIHGTREALSILKDHEFKPLPEILMHVWNIYRDSFKLRAGGSGLLAFNAEWFLKIMKKYGEEI